jgi:hypothetical protein
VDYFGAVAGLDGVYAAGDMTDEPLKHGGLAARRAGAAASAVAASLGADVEPHPYTPVVEAALLDGSVATGGLRSDLSDPAGAVLQCRSPLVRGETRRSTPDYRARGPRVGSGGAWWSA